MNNSATNKNVMRLFKYKKASLAKKPSKARIIILINTDRSKNTSTIFKFKAIIIYFSPTINSPVIPLTHITESILFKSRKIRFFSLTEFSSYKISSPDQLCFTIILSLHSSI